MPFAARTPFDWRLRTRSLALGPRTLLMGILNVTPDSFSDGGLHDGVGNAVRHGLALLDEGANILDVGGESTRPNAVPLSAEEEQARILPVLRALLKERPEAILSVDTYHAATARAAVEAGAEIVNDVSGLQWDDAMAQTCADLCCGLVLTHTRGRPREWSALPPLPPAAVMPVVLTGLRASLLAARTAGVSADRIVLDPGFGFGKGGEENYAIHAMLDKLHQFGLPVLTGSSRKGFLRATLARLHNGEAAAPNADASVQASHGSAVAAVLGGAHLVRVHDVQGAAIATAIADAVLQAAAGVQRTTSQFSTGSSSTPQQFTPTATN